MENFQEFFVPFQIFYKIKLNKVHMDNQIINSPEGKCIMEMILPPIQGTILRSHSLLFSSMGVLESSIPLGPETSSSISGIWIAFSAKHSENSSITWYRFGICTIFALHTH